jgi:transglutaminase-like putative cysteine protease
MLLTTLALSALLSTQGAKLDSSRPHRSFRFVYTAAVPTVTSGAKQVRLWIPVPLDTSDQTIGNLELETKNPADGQAGSSVSGAKAADLKDGSKGQVKWTFHDIGGGFGRSVCVESPGTPIEVALAFDVTRYETKGGGKATPEELAELKRPDKMIPLDGKVAAVAAGLKLPSDPKAAVRSLYDHTLERMKYDKPEADKSWGRGDAEWACDARFGNCTDFHSYFMGLARVKGMPARFEMGFSIPGGNEKEAKVGGYHCWAYVWLEGQGWMPVDISEADKHPEKTDFFFGTLDADRVTMTGGRDLTLTPAPAAGVLNFFVYPYAEVDGQKVEAAKSFLRINP